MALKTGLAERCAQPEVRSVIPPDLETAILHHHSALAEGNPSASETYLMYPPSPMVTKLRNEMRWPTYSALTEACSNGVYQAYLAGYANHRLDDRTAVTVGLCIITPGRFPDGFPPIRFHETREVWVDTPKGWKVIKDSDLTLVPKVKL